METRIPLPSTELVPSISGAAIAHHPLGFSSLGTRSLCAGSMAAEEKPALSLPQDDRGTRCHKAIEHCNLNGLSDDEAAVVERCFLWEEEKIEALGLEQPTQTHVEERFDLFDSERRLFSFGTPDKVLVFGFERGAVIVDWKFHPTGNIPQIPAYYQLLSASIAVLQRYPDLKSALAFCFAPSSGREYSLKLKREDIPDRISALEKIRKDCSDPQAPLTAGSVQCKFCSAAATCSAARDASNSITALSEGAGSKDSLVIRETDSGWEILDQKRLAEMVSLAKVARTHADAFLELVKRALESGEACEGLALKGTGSTWSLSSYDEAWTSLEPRWQARINRKWTISEAERAYHDLNPHLKLPEVKRQVEQHFAGWIRLKKKRPSLQEVK